MTTIDVNDMLSRFNGSRQRPTDGTDWQQLLATEGNRRLIELIITHRLSSVSELTSLTGRAQPNVSRALAALARAGIVYLRQSGRASVPTMTAFGSEKAALVGILAGDATLEPDPAPSGDHFLSASLGEATKDADRVHGTLNVTIPFRDRETARGRIDGDLTRLAERWSSDWWRMLCRREAYHLCDLDLAREGVAAEMRLSVQPRRGRINLIVRMASEEAEQSKPLCFSMLAEAFETALTDGLFAPVARELTRRGEVDRTLHGNLAHIEDIRGDSRDLSYWRTAGAMGLRLGDDAGDAVQKLMEEIPDEDARLEFASAVLSENVAGAAAWVARELADNRDRNDLKDLLAIARDCRKEAGDDAAAQPYRRGVALARQVRKLLRMDPEAPLGGMSGLASKMGADNYAAGGSTEAAGQIRGFRSNGSEGPAVVIDGSHGPASSMFLLARGIGDYIAFMDARAPITDVYTDRQKIGRAFAAELIAPSRAVIDFINEGQPRLRIAGHFGTTPVMIDHQYDNNASIRD